MAEHKLFYFPYASLTDEQLPLLKVAALYLDKLYLLDPVGATWDRVGANETARKGVRLLREAGILEAVSPAEVLATYSEQLSELVKVDMADNDFLGLCDAHTQRSGQKRWTLALVKVPDDLQADERMRTLLGPFARSVARTAAYATEDYIEHKEALSYLPGMQQGRPPGLEERADDYREYSVQGTAYDEYRETDTGITEYRYADFPLALGESIMLNHALLGGLLYADATPITDDPFHSNALNLKLARAVEKDAAVQRLFADRGRSRVIKANQLALTALTDTQLELPVLNPKLPLETVLEYRQAHEDDLARARERLAWIARRIEAEPWSNEFERELEHRTIPDLQQQLGEARKALDSWQKSGRGRRALSGAGIAVGAATAVLGLVTAPVTPVALAVVGLGLASGSALPGAEWLLDWREGKEARHENGLHYLLQVR